MQRTMSRTRRRVLNTVPHVTSNTIVGAIGLAYVVIFGAQMSRAFRYQVYNDLPGPTHFHTPSIRSFMSAMTARETQPHLNRRHLASTHDGRKSPQLIYQHMSRPENVLESKVSDKRALTASLSQPDSPVSVLVMAKLLKAKGESMMNAWAAVAYKTLDNIRLSTQLRLSELRFLDIAVEHFAKFELPDFAFLNETCSNAEIFADVCAWFSDLEFIPVNGIPILSDHILFLHAYLSSLSLSSELAAELSEQVDKSKVHLEQVVRNAVKLSFEGSRLIQYCDLPHEWRNNPYVTQGYRFIPIERWHLIFMSLFALHNETLNIHTHLIPLFIWSVSSITVIDSNIFGDDGPEIAFSVSVLVCLFTSVLWHTMSGCAHRGGMKFCARVDYVGIGWLISSSVGTVVSYGFQCYPHIGQTFLVCSLLTGIAGNIFPFMEWFDTYEYRMWRVSFFLSLAFTVIAPLATLAYLHSVEQVSNFVYPTLPPVVSYLLGLTFYATQLPERFIANSKLAHRLDSIGVGSHAIWHIFIILGISQHKAAMTHMRNGMGCKVPFEL